MQVLGTSMALFVLIQGVPGECRSHAGIGLHSLSARCSCGRTCVFSCFLMFCLCSAPLVKASLAVLPSLTAQKTSHETQAKRAGQRVRFLVLSYFMLFFDGEFCFSNEALLIWDSSNSQFYEPLMVAGGIDILGVDIW